MIPQDTTSSPSNWLFRTAKALVELALVWSAVGYISLRAFCNYHDVPLIPNLGVERYLQETYSLLVNLIIPKTLSIIFLAAILGTSLLALLLSSSPVLKLERALHKVLREYVISGILFVLVLVSAFGFGNINVWLMSLANNSLVGPLSKTRESAGSGYLDRALLLTVVIWGSWYAFRPNGAVFSQASATYGQKVLRGFLFLFGVLTAFFIPIVSGASMEDREFFVVDIHLQDVRDSVRGMRIFESATQMIYWSADDNIGMIHSIPLSKVASVDYLCADNITAQMQRAARGIKAPVCVEGETRK